MNTFMNYMENMTAAIKYAQTLAKEADTHPDTDPKAEEAAEKMPDASDAPAETKE